MPKQINLNPGGIPLPRAQVATDKGPNWPARIAALFAGIVIGAIIGLILMIILGSLFWLAVNVWQYALSAM